MRTGKEVALVLRLAAEGRNKSEIARVTGIPRGTVRMWLAGQLPASVDLGRRSCQKCGHPAHDFSALPRPEYAYLLGAYLGDGSISSHPRSVFKLRIYCDARYPGIIDEIQRAAQAVMPRSAVVAQKRQATECFEVYTYSKAWPCFFPQHGAGRKHERRIELSKWQRAIVRAEPQRFLRGLIHSDGSRSANTVRHGDRVYSYPRYLFSNRSEDIKRLFCETCDALGVEWRVMNRSDISVARRDSVALLDSFVGPKR